MPELRKDPIVGGWVIIAANRAERPGAFISSQRRQHDGDCPFCEGHEGETPRELLACRDPGTASNEPGWRVRVVTNKFPALLPHATIPAATCEQDESNPAPDTPSCAQHAYPVGSLFEAIPALGAHEVVIESSRHVVSTSDLSPEELAEVFGAYRQRLVDLRRDPRLVQPVIFKNVGEVAGASIDHTHSQLMVLGMVPAIVQQELDGAREFYRQSGLCVFCEMIRQELEAARRMVFDTPRFAAFCPFASRFPYEIWVLPKRHASHYETIDEAGLKDLAVVMKQVITKIEAALGQPAYNYLIHTAPFDTLTLKHYHWHIEVVPVLTKPAGFELGSGYYVNPVLPEDAAGHLSRAHPSS